MKYDVVIIGAGISGLSAALSAVKEGKKVIVVSKGLGNLYSSSGYIDVLGYYPIKNNEPILKPKKALNALVKENPKHPYSLVKDHLELAVDEFFKVTEEINLPYVGSLEKNMMMPTAIGSLVPTTIYPKSNDKDILKASKIVVVGIKELIDFYPNLVCDNLKNELKAEIKAVTIDLGLKVTREFNSHDLALAMEKKEVRNRFIKQIKNLKIENSLVLLPAILGVFKARKIIDEVQNELKIDILEIPTLPPSVMGFRLAEGLMNYLKSQGVEFLLGNPVIDTDCEGDLCTEIGIQSTSGRIKKIEGRSFILATGGVLGEGLEVSPNAIKEGIFSLPVDYKHNDKKSFFGLEEDPHATCGVVVNECLQPVQNGKIVLKNVYIAGATLRGYDPFIEKSGNGVALVSGYKAGLIAAKGGENCE